MTSHAESGRLAAPGSETMRTRSRRRTVRRRMRMAREFELDTPIDGTPDQAWAVLTDFDAYPRWNHLVPFASGATVPGARVLLRVRGPGRRLRPMRPTIVSIDPPRELVFQTSVGHRSLIHMVHSFTFVGSVASGVSLRQRWVATGALVPVLWPLLRLAMARFSEFGADLSARVSDIRSGAV